MRNDDDLGIRQSTYRRPIPPPWHRFKRKGDFWRNPIVVNVVSGLFVALIVFLVPYLWQRASAADWQKYRDMLAAHAYQTNDPDRLRAIVQSLQKAQ